MMNDKFTNEPNKMDEWLSQIAESAAPNAQFATELERTLRLAHSERSAPGWFRFTRRQTVAALAWTVSLIAFALFMNWAIRMVAPTPTEIPASNETSAPTATALPNATHEAQATLTPDAGGYEWRDTILYLAQPMPRSPAEAKVYLKKFTGQATPEDVLALAQRFGIDGEIQHVPSGEFPGRTDYIVSGDRRQKLEVRADYYFVYHSNFEELHLDNLSDEQARSVTDNFLKQHGFDFEYKFERAPEMSGMQFYITPLILGEYAVHFDYMNPWRYEITLDNTGENIIFIGYALEFEELGNFGIITVEEAFQKILDQNPQTGLMEIFNGRGGGGGGSSFLKININETPVVFPSPTPPTIVETPRVEYDPAFTMPTATIESIELAYYVRYPPYVLADPSAGIQYLQPVWRFYGHYSNGDEFEILVQALKEEYLLPEPAPYTPPG